MRSHERNLSLLRRTRFETVEERLMLSADSWGDFYVNDLISRVEQQFDQIESMLTDVHDSYGVSHARDVYGFEGHGQTVAVIDSGIAYDHEALGGGLGTGYRVVGGWDFTEENDADPYDDAPAGFHGTHVAGIIGSSDPIFRGVAPSVDLVALRVFNDCGAGYFSWVENALRWVHENRNQLDNPITAVNLSLGANWNSDSVPAWGVLEDEFSQLAADGIFISVAAGNDFQWYRTPGLGYPAASPHVVPVASVTHHGDFSSFSQRHDRVIAAPGDTITSTVPDYLFDFNGVTDDFGTASGTSMAAPYLAGASVLVRQAMSFAGYDNINQRTIYDHFRNTADVFYDPATEQNYHRLNLINAMDSLMPEDDYGSTIRSAFSLGTLSDDTSFSGIIGTIDDHDFFTFTAGQTGIATFTVDADDDLDAQWNVGNTGGTTTDTTLTLGIIEGQSYTVSLSSNNGIARYHIEIEITAAIVDWGIVEQKQIGPVELDSRENLFQFTATRDGLLTVEAFFSHVVGNIDLEVYNAHHQLLGTSNSQTNTERIDVVSTAGDVFYLHAHGVNAEVAFRLTNLVELGDRTVDAHGTLSDDIFFATAGTTPRIAVNGVQYHFGSDILSIFLHGGAGNDCVKIRGSSSNDSAVMQHHLSILTTNKYHIQANDFACVNVHGGQGTDTVSFYDSSGDEPLDALAAGTYLLSSDFKNQAWGFERSYVYSTVAGNDDTRFFDSSGGHQFNAFATYTRLKGPGFEHTVYGFARTHTYSTTAGNDEATFIDNAINTFTSHTWTIACVDF